MAEAESFVNNAYYSDTAIDKVGGGLIGRDEGEKE
jgi:hypothetical protein